MPKKKLDCISLAAIKRYIIDAMKMRSSKPATKKLGSELNATIEAVIAEAARLAKKDKRDTIMGEDITAAIEKLIGKKHLTWKETVEQVLQQNPTDLGKISKAINDYIEKRQKKK